MIEKLKAFIENSNKEIQKKLLTEINVESSENDILVQSFLTKDFKEKIKEQLETIYRYIGRCGYKDIEILKSKLDLFFYKGSSNIEDLVEENEKAIEFLRSNPNERIRKYIKEKNITYKEFAKLAKVHEKTVSRWIKNKSDVSLKESHNVMKVLDGKINLKHKSKDDEMEI